MKTRLVFTVHIRPVDLKFDTCTSEKKSSAQLSVLSASCLGSPCVCATSKSAADHPCLNVTFWMYWFVNKSFCRRTTRGCARRWRRSSERGRSWSGSSGGSWRTSTTPPGTRPTSEIGWTSWSAGGSHPTTGAAEAHEVAQLDDGTKKKKITCQNYFAPFKRRWPNTDSILYIPLETTMFFLLTWLFAVQMKHLKSRNYLTEVISVFFSSSVS